MPTKAKFTAERIVNVAFGIVRREGWAPLSARAIAKELKSSTNPIYFHMKTMKNIQNAVMKKAIDLCIEYIKVNRTGDRWIDQGVGYVIFARDEKYLFRSIIDEKFLTLRNRYYPYFWKVLDDDIRDYALLRELPLEITEKIRHARSVFSFGLATMASSAINYENLRTEAQIIDLIQTASFSLYHGIKGG